MYKAYLEGIEVYLTSESYISKYSFLNNKSIDITLNIREARFTVAFIEHLMERLSMPI